MLISLFLVFLSHFLFAPCGRLSWLSVSFLLHVKYTVSYRIITYRREAARCFVSVCSQLSLIVQHVERNRLDYYWLLRLQIYRCVQLIRSVLFSSLYSLMSVVNRRAP